MTDIVKPKRTFSRALVIWFALIPGWSAIAYAMWLGVQMATIVVPSMVLLIGAVIGVYQGVGHADFRRQLEFLPRPRRARRSAPTPSTEGQDA